MLKEYLVDYGDGPQTMTLCDQCQKEIEWTTCEGKTSGGCEHQGDNCEDA